jgi:hypothetical protein
MSVYAVTFNKSETDEEKTVLQKLCISGEFRPEHITSVPACRKDIMDLGVEN